MYRKFFIAAAVAYFYVGLYALLLLFTPTVVTVVAGV